MKRLRTPNVLLNDTEHMVLSHNTAVQLHLIPEKLSRRSRAGRDRGPTSIFEVLNLTATDIGHRYLYSRLLNPLVKPEKIKRNYDLTKQLLLRMQDNATLFADITKLLVSMDDVEKLYRKLILDVIKPSEVAKLLKTYFTFDKINRLFNFAGGSTEFSKNRQELVMLMDWMLDKFNLDAMEKYIPQEGQVANFVNEGLNINLYRQFSIYDSHTDYLAKVAGFLNGLDTSRSHAEIVFEDMAITTSQGRGKAIQAKTNGKFKATASTSSKCIITSVEIEECTNRIISARNDIIELLDGYMKVIKFEIKKYPFISQIHSMIGEVDFICNNIRLMQKYQYNLPEIDLASSPEAKSYIEITELRHPLVERRIKYPYVTNDISLGGTNTNGLLLYGCCLSGKTTFTKAVATAIIMAQGGFPVAGHMKYRPFSRIFSRLSTGDSLLKGLSSFEVEMRELNTIQRHANSNSFIAADEIARGCDSASGEAIVLAALMDFTARKIPFISSTHFHNIAMVKEIVTLINNKSLQISHLTSVFKDDKLVLDRKLKPGNGETNYGIEVLKALWFQRDFVMAANGYRHQLLGKSEHIVNNKVSRYNSETLINECALCSSTNDLETHHVIPQRESKNGFIGHFSKNIQGNLLVLCRQCHAKCGEQYQFVVTSRGLEVQTKV